MQIGIGDLVTCRSSGDKIGLVVAKKISNEGLTLSAHAQHLLSSYSNVYYIYFSGEGTSGPFLPDEVRLQQQIRLSQSLRDEL